MEGPYQYEFWIDKAAERSGLRSVDDEHDVSLPGGVAPYIFILVVVIVDIVVLPLVGYFQTGTFLTLINPADILLLPAWLLVVWSTLRLRERYTTTVEENLPEQHTELADELSGSYQLTHPIISRLFPSQASQGFDTFFPRRQKLLILVLGWAYYVGWIVTDPTAGEFVAANAGEFVAVAKFGVIYPLVYYPLGVEFLTVFLAIHVLLPYKITRFRLIDFEDLEGYGGLRPVGRLSKTSTLHYLLLLSLYAGFISLARGVSTLQPSVLIIVVGGMLFGTTLFFLPILWLGLYMQSQKHAKINQIAADIKEIGQDDSTFPETEAVSTDNASIYTHEFARLTVVKDMKDYPVDIFTIRDFLYALPAPILVNIFTSYLTKNVLPI